MIATFVDTNGLNLLLSLLQLIKFFYQSRDTLDCFRFAYTPTYRLYNLTLFRRGISLICLGKQAFFLLIIGIFINFGIFYHEGGNTILF